MQLPAPSIIIEWETGLECAGGRVHACLGALAGQLAELGPRFAAPAQTIISHHPAQVPEAVIREAVARAAGVWPGILRIVASPGPRPLHYYQKKNFGFGFATGDVVIFLDSDVIPEPGWLRSLLEPFNDYRKAVVVGHTHLVARTFYERAMALCWIFDTRIQEDRVEPHHRLLSNNNAFRRAVFARFPFQDLPTYRVSCGELSKSLRRAGIVLYRQSAARASHPAPPGPGGFLAVAFHAGRDQRYMDGLDRQTGPWRFAQQWRLDLTHVGQRIAARRGDLQAGALEVAAARLLGLLYYTLKAASYLAAPDGPAPGSATRART